MKSILLHIHKDEGQEARYQAATDIVRAFGGHLICLQATPFETFVFGDPFGGVYALPAIISQIREEEREEREAIEKRLSHAGINWDWRSYDGPAAKALVDQSRLADLIVVSHVPATSKKLDMWPPIAADVAIHARAPVLAVPARTESFACDGKAVIAWNGSFEAAQAVRSSLPLLKRASSVALVTIAEHALDHPPTDAGAYLARHGVDSELFSQPANGNSIADALRAAIAAQSGDYLVMGAYGHSRVREKILGGVTQDLLSDCPVPVLLAH